jgi:hypothetical protein
MAESGDSKSKKFLFERISLAIQRGNAASIRVTFPNCALLWDIFVLENKNIMYFMHHLINSSLQLKKNLLFTHHFYFCFFFLSFIFHSIYLSLYLVHFSCHRFFSYLDTYIFL